MTKKVGIMMLGAVLLAGFAINIQAAKPTVKISASPASIVVGSPSTLTWTSTGATLASINQGIGSVAVNGSRVVSPTATTTYTITVKNSSGSTTAKATITVKAAPPTVTFSASPVTIPPGGSATLSWTTTNATSASIDQSIGTVALNGSKVVKPTVTKTYTITVKGSGGTVMAKTTVMVAVAPPTVTFSAAPAIISPGQSSKLTWSVQNATSVSIDNGIGTVSANSSRTVTPTATTIYTLNAKGTGGTTTSQTTITVAQPPIVTFSAAPMSIKPGESSTLTWTTTDATTASIDNTIGTVPVNGSIQVTPTENTTYTITVSGPGGTATAQTAVFISNGKICYAYVPNSSANNVAVIDTTSNTIIKTIPARKGPMGVAISQDGTRVFISSIYDQMYIQTLDTAANAVIYEEDTQYATCGAKFLAVDDTHTSKYLYAASLRSFWDSWNYTWASALFVYNMAQSGQIGQIKCLLIPGGEQGGMVLHPDGTRLYLSKPGENAILCLDTTKLHRPKPNGATYEYLTDEVIATIQISNPYSLTISPDGNRLYAAGTDGILVLDTNSNTILNTIATVAGSTGSLAMHPDGHELYVASANLVQAIDTATNAITKTLTISSYDSSMNVHPDGSRLYITSYSPDNVYVVDTASLTLIATIPIEGYPKAYGNFVGYISESIAGKISQDGVGVADVKVTVASAKGSSVAVTDAAGNYLTAVAKGTYSVTPEKAGYTFIPEQREVTIGEHSVAQIDFTTQVLPPVITAEVNPDRIDPQTGGSALLSWDVRYADSLTLDGEAVSMQGSRNVSPSVTTTYHFIATNTSGTVTKDILLYSGNLPTIQANANPVGIIIGGTSTITWSSTKADSVSIDQGIGSVAINGSMQVSPTVTTTYTLTATGYGQSVTTMVTVIVGTPPTITATANPAVIISGESTTLNWTTINATSVSLSYYGIWNPISVPVNGSHLVSPTSSQRYTFEAKNQIGSTYAYVWVTVCSLPIPTVTIAAAPTTIQIGGSSTLTWTSTNATSASIDNGIGTVPLNGSIVVTPAATTTYKITVTGPEVSTSAQTTVTVSGPSPTVAITATPDTIPPGGSSTLTWTTTNAVSVAIDQGIGNVQLNGSLEVKPAAETTYTIMASGPGGTAMASVTVKMLDSLLRGVWNRMKTAMLAGNVNQVVAQFSDQTHDQYSQIFTAIADQLPQIAQEMKEIEPVYFEEFGAKFRIKRTEEIEGVTYDITYYIYFVQEEDGSWKILNY
jgi:YVTN family beta-propeller protein